MRDLFSIVTSFYGESQEYVSRLYRSICLQNVNWEWIVTDDFSDNPITLQTLSEISVKDPRVKLVHQREKREIFRNPSIYAQGDYIFHIDGDDDVHPNYLAHCLMWFNRFPRVQCILSSSLFETERGNFGRYAWLTEENRFQFETYLGRVWRAGFTFNWAEIFSDPREVIRFNDRFIVKKIECEGDILFLPRIYIRYTMRENSNTSRERTENERESIVRSIQEFELWYEKNKRSAPLDPFFFGLEKYLLGFFEIDWKFSNGSIHYSGPEIQDFHQKKIQDLFPEFSISFNRFDDTDPDIRIIDCSKQFIDSPLGNDKTIVVCRVDDAESKSHYEELFYKEARLFKYNYLWDYVWMVSLT